MAIPFGLLNLPEDNGAILAIPPVAGYPAAARRNRGLNPGLTLGGEPLERFRMAARKAALDTARKYTLSLGLDPGPVPGPEGLVFASGHQPVIFHPGIMIKADTLARSAGECGAAALFVTVDSDEFRAEYAPIPTVSAGRLTRMEYPLFPIRSPRLYETAEAEPVADFFSRLEAMAHFMGDPRLARPREAMESSLARLKNARLDFPDYVSRVIALRRALTPPGTPGFLEAPVSILSQTAPFLSFAAGIMGDIERFAEVYNRALDAFRKARKLRYPANPFPNLERKQEMIQAPFWAVRDGARMKLYVRPGGKISLALEDGTQWPLAAVADGKIQIRPKAITLSLYMRLALCDLFIHGVGGAKYDHVTADIITGYWGATEPELACLSATRWPDIPVEDPRPRIVEVERALRDMDFHPEKAGAGLPEMDALARDKAALVDAIKAPGADKKTLGEQIAGLNRRMSALLDGRRRKLREEMELLAPMEMERQAAHARDYPWFLLPAS